MTAITAREQGEIDEANASGQPPVVFVHGLWLLANSWDPWRVFFQEHGFTTLAPGWPDDPETVAAAREHPAAFAGKTVGAVTDHIAAVIKQLDRKPVVIGHSFGGMIAQKLAGLVLAAVTVAIAPPPIIAGENDNTVPWRSPTPPTSNTPKTRPDRDQQDAWARPRAHD